ncbi:MAG: hypothetical protein ACK5QX_02575 [bacterium]
MVEKPNILLQGRGARLRPRVEPVREVDHNRKSPQLIVSFQRLPDGISRRDDMLDRPDGVVLQKAARRADAGARRKIDQYEMRPFAEPGKMRVRSEGIAARGQIGDMGAMRCCRLDPALGGGISKIHQPGRKVEPGFVHIRGGAHQVVDPVLHQLAPKGQVALVLPMPALLPIGQDARSDTAPAAETLMRQRKPGIDDADDDIGGL